MLRRLRGLLTTFSGAAVQSLLYRSQISIRATRIRIESEHNKPVLGLNTAYWNTTRLIPYTNGPLLACVAVAASDSLQQLSLENLIKQTLELRCLA